MYWHFRIFFFYLLDDMTNKQEVGRTKYSKLIIRSLIKYINRIYDKLKILDRDWFSAPICNGNRTEWSPIRSVIIRVITKSDDRAAGVRFVYHKYDYRQNWTTRSLITN